MKKVLALILAIGLALSLAGCGSESDADSVTPSVTPEIENTPQKSETVVSEEQSEQEAAPPVDPEPASEDDEITNEAWDELEALGEVQTENGVFYVTITLPADLVGTDVTQESLDADAGENYISATLNDDGSVSYKMTKQQHKAMLDGMVESMEQSLQEMLDGDEYSYTKIDHNRDFTQFDVTISGTELNFYDSFGTLAFYMYGGFYSLFSGQSADHVIVNFYDTNGELIETADSANMGD